jgi:inosine/xanthosine triphosphate pyrophosphatase family protein
LYRYGQHKKIGTGVVLVPFLVLTVLPFLVTIAPHADPVLFTGRVHGTIVEPIEGRGFGWDSIFVPNGEDLPFSCLSTEQKNELSHRGNAVRQWARVRS